MSNLWPGLGGAKVDSISSPPTTGWQNTFPRHIGILGSTGSIGKNALSVIAAHPDIFRVVGLSCADNVMLLAEQTKRFHPPYLAVASLEAKNRLVSLLEPGYSPHIFVGQQGYIAFAQVPEASTIVCAQSGAAGLSGTLSAALAGRVLCLANKESLVLAGDLIRSICKKTNASILPVDSEHNALFQCLAGRGQNIETLVLTASGGPFRNMNQKELESVSCEQALKHPNWSMGKKITIDSATMMNKGLEIIEASHLFGIDVSRIEVLVHPQSIVHSMVRFSDGSLLAQMAVADMKLPIAHCLAWPKVLRAVVDPLPLFGATLTFTEPDEERFPCLFLAKQALAKGRDFCVVLNAANECAVDLFLQKKCRFVDIAGFVSEALSWYSKTTRLNVAPLKIQDLGQDALACAVWEQYDALLTLDAKTRAYVQTLL